MAHTNPRQNRIDPWGRVVATPERGTLHGNRGVLHDDQGRIVRHAQVRRWIACELEYKGWRRHPLVQAGRYTELFFLDEVTALAAGHRPCFLCRRSDALDFQQRWRTWQDVEGGPTADTMDRVLSEARRTTEQLMAVDLPQGAMFAADDDAYAVWGGQALAWSFGGYGQARPLDSFREVEALTCAPVRAVLEGGYVPRIHPSGGG